MASFPRESHGRRASGQLMICHLPEDASVHAENDFFFSRFLPSFFLFVACQSHANTSFRQVFRHQPFADGVSKDAFRPVLCHCRLPSREKRTASAAKKRAPGINPCAVAVKGATPLSSSSKSRVACRAIPPLSRQREMSRRYSSSGRPATS